MIPIGDTVQRRNLAWMTWLLIAANAWVFLVQILMGRGQVEAFLGRYALVPASPHARTFVSHMFLHVGLAHLIGNVWFLWLLGDNVEDRMGPFRFLAFYLLCGLAAAAAQFLIGPSSPVPMVGASGAIAGVLGAYLVLYPRAPVTVFVFIFFLSLPAWLVVGFWFVWNLLGGVGSLLPTSQDSTAFFAHIGGFLGGMLLVRPLIRRRRDDLGRWEGWRQPTRRSRSRYEAWRDYR